ncbi:MAG: hypothetical protein ACQET7_13380 [Thermodesulfobacteriota bacterium]
MDEKRDAYIQKLRARMDEWNAEIDFLSAKADQAKAETKIEYLKRLEDLRAKRRDLQEKIVEVEQAGESAWEDLKQGLENSWTIFKTSLTKAKSEFERGYKGEKEDE